jgi:hypothetical protein
MIRMQLPASGRRAFTTALAVIVFYQLAVNSTLARAQSDTDNGKPAESQRVNLPLQTGFFDGAAALYITPEVGVDPNASADIIAAAKQVAAGFNSNFIPQNFGILPARRRWMTSSCSLILPKEMC